MTAHPQGQLHGEKSCYTNVQIVVDVVEVISFVYENSYHNEHKRADHHQQNDA